MACHRPDCALVFYLCLMKKLVAILLGSLFLLSCSGGKHYAPVRSIATAKDTTTSEVVNSKTNSSKAIAAKTLSPIPRSGKYVVRKSDTLYSIAFKFGLDFQKLAKFNQINGPYTIFPNQVLNLRTKKKKTYRASTGKKVIESKKPVVAKQQNKNNKIANSGSKNKEVTKKSTFDQQKKVTVWMWPVKNRAQKKISSWKSDHQGINISGKFGEPVKATAAGRVVYSGSGLVGYGNLIIIKHSQSFLSAYANNDKLAVKENDLVKAGQKIATMGKNDTGLTELHFEIRHQGRPVNPLKYLPRSN